MAEEIEDETPTIELPSSIPLAIDDPGVRKKFLGDLVSLRQLQARAQPRALINAVALNEEGLIVQHLFGVEKLPPDGDGFQYREVENPSVLGTDHFKTWPRKERDALLAASDWSQLPDAQASMSEDKKAAWAEYRQQLRDLPETQSDPANVVWPDKP